jgi:transcriptional regulator with XRE-family HTH domain
MTVVVVRTPQDIGALIKSRRRSLGMSQADLASKLGTSLVLILQAISALGLELTTDDEGKGAQESKTPSGDALTRELRRRAT